MAWEIVAEGAGREGFSLLVFADGVGDRRRYWWACCGCASRGRRADDERAVWAAADEHGQWCSVLRADAA